MAWDGYFQYAGNEIINVARTEAYAAGLPWFKPLYKNDALPAILGDGHYTSPLVDDAPWADPDVPESYGFYGLYPLNVTGIEDSSRASTVTESIRDGGYAGRLRLATKSVVFSGVLIGEDDAACAYGMRWLKQALTSGPCDNDGDCTGVDLCYLDSEPAVNSDGATFHIETGDPIALGDIDAGAYNSSIPDEYDGGDASDDGETPLTIDAGGPSTNDGGQTRVLVATPVSPTDCFDPLLRTLRKALVNNGPSITSKNTTSDGGAAWTVSFTTVVGEPWEYGVEVAVIEGFLDPAVSVPWVGGVVPDGGYLDLDGAMFDDTLCATPVWDPLQDPDCPAIIAPPLPPSVPLGCYNPPTRWRRRQITIPSSFIPLWGEVVPKFAVHARDDDVRNLRLRFYADVQGDGDVSDDQCAYCGDIVVSYIPQGSTLFFDASEREVYAVDASQRRRRADTVVFSTDGTPFDWPVLTCGFGYVVTLDLPKTQAAPVFDLSLFNRAA